MTPEECSYVRMKQAELSAVFGTPLLSAHDLRQRGWSNGLIQTRLKPAAMLPITNDGFHRKPIRFYSLDGVESVEHRPEVRAARARNLERRFGYR